MCELTKKNRRWGGGHIGKLGLNKPGAINSVKVGVRDPYTGFSNLNKNINIKVLSLGKDLV